MRGTIETVKKKPTPNSFPYFFGSVILIVTAIVATGILNRTANTATTQDVRARASVTSLMRLSAIITSVDTAQGMVVVGGMQFTGTTPQNLKNLGRNTAGEWQVSVSGNVNLAALGPGSRVELQVNPATFNISNRTLTAAAITLSR